MADRQYSTGPTATLISIIYEACYHQFVMSSEVGKKNLKKHTFHSLIFPNKMQFYSTPCIWLKSDFMSTWAIFQSGDLILLLNSYSDNEQ